MEEEESAGTLREYRFRFNDDASELLGCRNKVCLTKTSKIDSVRKKTEKWYS